MIKQYDVYFVSLDPTVGCEVQKTRPCLIISPDELNLYLKTVIIAPMTTKSRAYPTRIEITHEDKTGFIVLDQIRCVDKTRLLKKTGKLSKEMIIKIKNILKEMLID